MPWMVRPSSLALPALCLGFRAFEKEEGWGRREREGSGGDGEGGEVGGGRGREGGEGTEEGEGEEERRRGREEERERCMGTTAFIPSPQAGRGKIVCTVYQQMIMCVHVCSCVLVCVVNKTRRGNSFLLVETTKNKNIPRERAWGGS